MAKVTKPKKEQPRDDLGRFAKEGQTTTPTSGGGDNADLLSILQQQLELQKQTNKLLQKAKKRPGFFGRQMSPEERELRRIRQETEDDLMLYIFVLVLAFTAMGLHGLKIAILNAGAWLEDLPFVNLPASAANSSGEFASPIVGKSLQDLVSYSPSHGQSFGPETGNQRSYGAHGGVDFDCRVGGCAGAAVASPIAGKVSAIEKIGTSANGASYRLKIDGKDWAGEVEHRLVHVDSIGVSVGDSVTAGQVVAKVSPTDSVSTGPHLDWKIKRGGQWVNPQKWAAEAIENQGNAKGVVAGIDGIDIDFIKNLEGYHPCAYNDGPQYSWGHGTKAPAAGACMSGGKVQAEQELKSYLAEHCLPALPQGLNANQATAALSLCYNTGPGVKDWDIWRLMDNPATHGQVNFTRYTRSYLGDGSLLSRRQKEQAKWNQ
jgi:murein DD-endopeptidase MepM/ murein hydrolase activator NlpD/GH24 family phage-related lysozyme (muramidase)